MEAHALLIRRAAFVEKHIHIGSVKRLPRSRNESSERLGTQSYPSILTNIMNKEENNRRSHEEDPSFLASSQIIYGMEVPQRSGKHVSFDNSFLQQEEKR